MSRSPDACSREDVTALRSAGFADEEILSLVEIIAYQNMTTRIMEALSTLDS